MKNIAVLGLGYFGLPLAVEFGKIRKVIGFDTSQERVNELKKGRDSTQECSVENIKLATKLSFSSDVSSIKSAQIYIVTVPTPINTENAPDLAPLNSASSIIASVLERGDIVIYESTVFPGATEEMCVPILEDISGLEFNKDFFCGYSPERINPGDRINSLTQIKKVTSGSNEKIAYEIDNLYSSIIEAGTWLAPSIKVAEAAKVIENTQRDINISIVNEFALIFDKIGIDTTEVLEAASTKWNFMHFKPGLVGGHCIAVDPYYLSYKAKSAGKSADLIDTARKINNSIPSFIAEKVYNGVKSLDGETRKPKVLIIGFTFKADCPDLRNSKDFDIMQRLIDLEINVDAMILGLNEIF